MPGFKKGDRVKVMEGQYAGQSGQVFGSLSRAEACGLGADAEATTTFFQVRLDQTDEIVFVEETQLTPIYPHVS